MMILFHFRHFWIVWFALALGFLFFWVMSPPGIAKRILLFVSFVFFVLGMLS